MTTGIHAQLQQAMGLHRQGQLQQANQIYRQVLARQPEQLDALQMLGLAEVSLGQAAAALALFERAARLAPRNAGVQFNRGLTLLQLGRPAEAVDAFGIALGVDPGHAKAHLMRATALHGLGRAEEALDLIDQGAALVADPVPLWLQKGVWLYAAGDYRAAQAQFERVVAAQPALGDAWVNLGSTLIKLGQAQEAVAALDRALALAPGAPDIWFNRGLAFTALQRLDDALVSFEQAARLAPGNPEILVHLGNTQLARGLAQQAIESYEQVLALDPGRDFVFDAVVQARMQLCDWRSFDADRARVADSIRRGTPRVAPTRVFPLLDAPDLQLRCTQAFMANRYPVAAARPAGDRPRPDRIRIGYFSADYFDHATAFLLARVFELHDRSRFDIEAFSFGRPPDDAMHRRLRSAFDAFHVVDDLDDQGVADLAWQRQIDIAIDLKGLTGHGRPGIFAQRAAPIQAAYLGYPATLGLPAMDYLIADAVLVPPAARNWYSEKIITLPHSYQANDDTRPVPPAPSRTEAGLPPDAFVFCSLNSVYKITPEVFAVWMRLLQAVPGSVLWQLDAGEASAGNLRREAAARGVDPGRIVFAPVVPPAAHLARLACADLFLDTLPCNAHTSASDALWAGLPVLTCQGASFSARVAASLLHAAGLPELVTPSLAAYEARALELATQRDQLQALRARLATQGRTSPLFDSARFTRGLEAAFSLMLARHAAGLPPDHLDVPAC